MGKRTRTVGRKQYGWGCWLGMVKEEMGSMRTKEGRLIPNTDSGMMDTKGARRQAGGGRGG